MNRRLYEQNLSYFEEVRALDVMTPRQRAQALARGGAVDRMPVYMMADLVLPSMRNTGGEQEFLWRDVRGLNSRPPT